MRHNFTGTNPSARVIRRGAFALVASLALAALFAACGRDDLTPIPAPNGSPSPTSVGTPAITSQTAGPSPDPTATLMPTEETQTPPTPTATGAPESTPTPAASPRVTSAPTSQATAGAASPTPDPGLPPSVEDVSILLDDGGRMEWSHTEDLIAFDRKGRDGFYDIWTMNPDTSGQQCLTCDISILDGRHVGWPAWSPDGEWLSMQVEMANHPGGSAKARPGFGVDTNVWVYSRSQERPYRLTDLDYHEPAVLHPIFSHDGEKMVWGQRLTPPSGDAFLGGQWVLRMADFVVGPGGRPRLENHETIDLGPEALYEPHAFSEDNSKLLISANLEPGQEPWHLDIYTLDLETLEVVNLTETNDEWDEHAQWSPSGETIAWMSSRDCGCDESDLNKGLETDVWIMDADGSNKRRITFFNESDWVLTPGDKIISGDITWSPDGRSLIVRLIVDRGLRELLGIAEEVEPLVKVTFEEPQ